jgi:hypothetical protein
MQTVIPILIAIISVGALVGFSVWMFRLTQRTEIKRVQNATVSMGWQEVVITPAGFQPKQGFFFFQQHSYLVSYVDSQGHPMLAKCTCSISFGLIWES